MFIFNKMYTNAILHILFMYYNIIYRNRPYFTVILLYTNDKNDRREKKCFNFIENFVGYTTVDYTQKTKHYNYRCHARFLKSIVRSSFKRFYYYYNIHLPFTIIIIFVFEH